MTFVTVIIIAHHNRKQYLKSSLESCLNQTLGREFYEIVIVKDYLDPEIDLLVAKERLIQIISQGTIGNNLVDGIENSSGDVICFLDDDDLFCSDKLEIVKSNFENDQKLVFLRNEILEVDSKLERLNRLKEWGTKNERNIIFSKFTLGEKIPEEILRNSGLMSCISVRKSLLIQHTDYLRYLTTNQDIFIFYAAVASAGNLLLIPHQLTKYRFAASVTRINGNFQTYRQRIESIHLGDYYIQNYILGLYESEALRLFVANQILLERAKTEMTKPHRAALIKTLTFANKNIASFKSNSHLLYLSFILLLHDLSPSLFFALLYIINSFKLKKIWGEKSVAT